ncbi:MAG: hypothetical protein JRC86_12675, partial [Deltaproteobacteria bacterium]|nr:hypothetical protein [Deltaproteobacteria bacterium]
FEVGDIANLLYLGHVRAGAAVTFSTICWAVGIYYGKAAGTIRRYAEAAAMFTDQDRAKYEALSFSHFVAAKGLGGQAEEALDYALDNIGMSARAMKVYFVGRSLEAHPGGDAMDVSGYQPPLDLGPDTAPGGVVVRAPTPQTDIPWLNTVGRIMVDLNDVEFLVSRADIPEELSDNVRRSLAAMKRALDRLRTHLTNRAVS